MLATETGASPQGFALGPGDGDERGVDGHPHAQADSVVEDREQFATCAVHEVGSHGLRPIERNFGNATRDGLEPHTQRQFGWRIGTECGHELRAFRGEARDVVGRDPTKG